MILDASCLSIWFEGQKRRIWILISSRSAGKRSALHAGAMGENSRSQLQTWKLCGSRLISLCQELPGGKGCLSLDCEHFLAKNNQHVFALLKQKQGIAAEPCSSLDQLHGPFLTSSLPSQGHSEILLQAREVKPQISAATPLHHKSASNLHCPSFEGHSHNVDSPISLGVLGAQRMPKLLDSRYAINASLRRRAILLGISEKAQRPPHEQNPCRTRETQSGICQRSSFRGKRWRNPTVSRFCLPLLTCMGSRSERDNVKSEIAAVHMVKNG